MRSKRLVLTAFVLVFLAPIPMLANGILDFNIQANLLTTGLLQNLPTTSFLQISSVEGIGGAESGVTLPVTNGSLDLNSSSGSLDITATGTIGSPYLTGTLLQASFTGVTPLFSSGGLELTLNGFSASIDPGLAGYYGLSDSATSGTVYISGSSAYLSVDPAIPATEGGGFPLTLSIFLAAGLCFTLAVRLKMIEVAL